MTGNTWDIIKIQTKTNQLMMGNRKDHIRVRGQRQRKTKSDRCMVCYDRTIFENLESEGANNPNIEKISFKVVQIKLLVCIYLQ